MTNIGQTLVTVTLAILLLAASVYAATLAWNASFAVIFGLATLTVYNTAGFLLCTAAFLAVLRLLVLVIKR